MLDLKLFNLFLVILFTTLSALSITAAGAYPPKCRAVTLDKLKVLDWYNAKPIGSPITLIKDADKISEYRTHYAAKSDAHKSSPIVLNADVWSDSHTVNIYSDGAKIFKRWFYISFVTYPNPNSKANGVFKSYYVWKDDAGCQLPFELGRAPSIIIAQEIAPKV